MTSVVSVYFLFAVFAVLSRPCPRMYAQSELINHTPLSFKSEKKDQNPKMLKTFETF